MGKLMGELPRAELVRGDDVRVESVNWLWGGWLAAGKLHILGGQPSAGKTTIALALAATVTNGGNWPDGSQAEQGSVVIWSGEDDLGDTLAPRLHAVGADMTRVHFVQGVREGCERRAFDPANDVEALSAALSELPDVRLLVVDPIVSAVSGDSHKNAEVRRGLQPLVDLAHAHRCALLGITHFTKGTSGSDPVERITGSLAFGALARVVIVAAKARQGECEPAGRILARAKSNIGPDTGGFGYAVREGELDAFPGVVASRVEWGPALEGTARELLSDAEARDDENRDDAPGFLRELLVYGARQAKDIYREAESAGFSRDAMKRAKQKVGAVAIKKGMTDGWVWQLPLAEGRAHAAEGSEEREQNCVLSSHPSGRASQSLRENRPRTSGLVRVERSPL